MGGGGGGGGGFQKITLMRGGGACEKNRKLGGVIQFSNYTPPNPTSPPYPIKNERSLNSVERTNGKEAERGGGRISEKREKGAMITLISSLFTLFLICETWQFHQNITLKNY